jgi:hypothetical protein
MKYMMEIDAGMERANVIDVKGGPGNVLAKIAERFKPEAVYPKADTRGAYMIVDLSPEDMSELMFVMTWFTGGKPKFTPIMSATFDEVIAKAKTLFDPAELRQ